MGILVVLLLVLALILIPISAILNGWVLVVLWGWFVVPVFEVPALSLVPAMGLALIITFLTLNLRNLYDSEEGTEMALIKALAVMFAKPVLFLIFGWILQLFM